MKIILLSVMVLILIIANERFKKQNKIDDEKFNNN